VRSPLPHHFPPTALQCSDQLGRSHCFARIPVLSFLCAAQGAQPSYHGAERRSSVAPWAMEGKLPYGAVWRAILRLIMPQTPVRSGPLSERHSILTPQARAPIAGHARGSAFPAIGG
jgi:hypothetical protein